LLSLPYKKILPQKSKSALKKIKCSPAATHTPETGQTSVQALTPRALTPTPMPTPKPALISAPTLTLRSPAPTTRASMTLAPFTPSSAPKPIYTSTPKLPILEFRLLRNKMEVSEEEKKMELEEVEMVLAEEESKHLLVDVCIII